MAEGEVRIKELEEVTTLTQNHYFVVDDLSSDGETKKYQADKVTAPLDNALLNEASSYDTTHTYNEGDYCLKDNVLYRCLYDNVTGTWTASKWVQTSLGADLTENTNDTQQAFVEGTASGTIATFHDGSNLPLKSLTADITALQDLHGYDYPWVGGAGKNKFDIDAEHTSESGTYTYTYVINVKPNTNYTMSTNAPQTSPASLYFNGGNTGVNGVWNGTPRTFTSDESGKLTAFVRFNTSQGGIDLYTAVKNGQYYIQLEEGSSVTSFAPYSNICPISGWSAVDVTRCGKNLVEDVISGWYITANGTFNVGSNYDMQIARVMKGQTYTVTSNEGLVAGFFVNKPTSSSTSYNGSRVDESNKTFIAPIDGYVAFRTEHNYATSQCELGSTATTYEPYNGNTYSLTFTDGTNPLTVYGGYVDLVSGVLTVDRAYITIDKDTTISRFRTTSNNIGVAYYLHTDILRNNSGGNCISNKLKTFTGGSFYNYPQAFSVAYDNYSGANYSVALATDTNITTQEEYVAWLETVGSIQVTYKLATPLTYSLTKQQIRSLVGVNNIFASTGAIKNVTYHRDNNTVINGLLNNIQFVTQAQYDALPSSKTSNGVLYFITG